jgi:autotransporter-associated beta strand protein
MSRSKLFGKIAANRAPARRVRASIGKSAWVAASALAGAVGLQHAAWATTYTWNNSGSGNWDGTLTDTSRWDTAQNAIWDSGDFNNIAYFNTAGATATVGTGGVSANGITFGNTATISAASGGTITLGGTTPTITLSANANAEIDAPLAGTVTQAGAGTLTLGGDSETLTAYNLNTTSGTLDLANVSGPALTGTINFGTGTNGQPQLNTTQANQFGSGTVINFINTTSGQNTRLDLVGNNQTLAGISDLYGLGVIQDGGNGGNGLTATTSATLTLNGSGNYSYAGILRDLDGGGHTLTLSLTYSGSGTQTLSGGYITYEGATTVSSGTLIGANISAFASAVTINNTGTFEVTNNANSTGYTAIMGASGSIVVNAGGTLELENTAGTYANRKTFANALSGAGTLEVNNAANAANDYLALNSVNNINLSGQINVVSGGLGNDSGSTSAFGTNTAGLNLATGTYFDLRGGASQFGALTGSGTVINSFSGTTLTIGAANGSGTFSGVIQNNGNSDTGTGGTNPGVVSLTKTGTGAQTLSGSNSYTGGTTISAGALLANSTGATNGSTGSGTVTVNSSGILGGSGQIRGSVAVNSGGVVTAGANAADPTTGAPAKLTANAASTILTIAGGTYDVKINAIPSEGSAGTNWDELALNQLSVTGSGTISVYSLTSGNVSGTISGFSDTSSYSWTIATAANTTLAAMNTVLTKLTLNTAGVSGASGGTFALSDTSDLGGSDLVLNYTPTPEISSLGLFGLGIAGLSLRRRRRENGRASALAAMLRQFGLAGSGSGTLNEACAASTTDSA